MVSNQYTRVAVDDVDGKERGNQPTRGDRAAQLWAVIIAVFVLAMLFALRAPSTPVDAPIPAQVHHGRPAANGHALLEYDDDDDTHDDAPIGDPPSFSAPSFSAPSFSAPSFSAPSFDAPSPEASSPTHPPTSAADPPPQINKPAGGLSQPDENGRSPNPYITKYVTTELRQMWQEMENKRKENSDDIKRRFGSWAPDGDHCNHCWTEDKVNHKHTVEEGDCECGPHHWDNQTNWDTTRRNFCIKEQERLEKKFPFPEELKYTLELSYKDGLDDHGDMKVPYRPLESGPPSGELPFDPATVKDHFLKLRAALTIYQQGEHIMEDLVRPHPDEPEYRQVLKAIAKRFAAAMVHGGDFIVGTIGDSTVAGADNCFFDAWPNGIERQLKPFFGAAKVNFIVRNGGHNGGFKMAPQLACASSIVGADADILVQSSPFVHPDNSDPGFEDMIRRATIEGMLVNIVDGVSDIYKTYGRFGVFNGGRGVGTPYGYNWYPSIGKSNWGRIGDGVCHVTKTRSGSAAVESRNWHPGPLGHENDQDSRVFLWADAAILALEEIESALKETDGKLDTLKKQWPRKVKVAYSELPDPKFCEGKSSKDKEATPFAQLCNPNGPIKNGWATCIGSLRPTFGEGNTWQEVTLDPSEAPNWGDDEKNEWAVQRSGPKSSIPRDFDCRDAASCSTIVESRMFTEETRRSTQACTHMDFEDQLSLKSGWTTVKIAKGRMNVGTITVCGKCGRDGKTEPQVMLKADGIDSKKLSFSWDRSKEWGFQDSNNARCGTIISSLDSKALQGDVLVGIKCGVSDSYVSYVFAQ